MGTFGISLRGLTVQVGGITQQSVQPTIMPIGTPTSTIHVGPTITTSAPQPASLLPATPTGASATGPIGPSALVGTGRIGSGVTPVITSRTINPQLVAPSILGTNKGFPTIARFATPTVPYAATRYREDVLRLSLFQIANGKFEIIEKNGISVLRPEIISMMNYSPIEVNRHITSAKKLILSQNQAIELRTITLEKLVADIRTNSDLSNKMNVIKRNFTTGLNKVNISLGYFSNLIQQTINLKNSLDPKGIPIASYNTTKYLPLIDFYERKMQYSKNKYANFSDTKILNQLITDLKKMLEGYSLSLLDLSDPDRASDTSPITIDKSYTQTNGFTFSPASIRSTTITRHAFKSDFFNQFLNSLPSNSDNRIKLLIHLLSRELRVSKQMSKTETTNKLNTIWSQTNSGNPFDNILGEVGNTIFDSPKGTNTLASLTLFNVDSNKLVLPFESIYVDAEESGKVYVPGSQYFIDSILETSETTGFNTTPYTSYVDKFTSILSDTTGIIEDLLELRRPGALSPTSVYDTFLKSIASSTLGLGSSDGINNGQAVNLAIFELAYTNTDLKNMLFEYLLLLGLSSIERQDEKNIFVKLANEIGNLSPFQHIRVIAGSDTTIGFVGQTKIRPYLEQISQDIENKVFSLTNTIENSRLTAELGRRSPSLTPTIVSPVVSGPSSRLSSTVGDATIIDHTTSNSSIFNMSFGRGEIKQILINNITSVGTSFPNICKEFVDLAVKLDQNASISSNQVYLLPDNTGRTRQNFYSTSTVLLFVFEILSALTDRYTFCSFGKGTSFTNGSITVDTAFTRDISLTIYDITATRSTVSVGLPPTGLTPLNSTSLIPLPTSIHTVVGFDATIETTRNPESSGVGGTSSPDTFSLGGTGLNPGFRFTGVDERIRNAAIDAGRILRLNEYHKTLLSNKTKLDEEDISVKNILHIFETINKQLTSSKSAVVETFTKSSLTNFLNRTNSKIGALNLVRNPSQVRVSSWLLDRYKDRLSDVGESVDSTGFIMTDKIPAVNLAAMFSMLSEPDFRNKNSSLNMKLLTIGVPSGFSKNISDRISKTAINETNFKNKQFDIISINVYKRDARFDDLVFKPQKFVFDLSLFPTRNLLPESLAVDTMSYGSVVRNAIFKDYESLQNKVNIKLADITRDVKYDFLSLQQKTDMISNHVKSELLELYIRLIAGITMNEETFSSTNYNKVNTQDEKVLNLYIEYLKVVKHKQIPNQPIADLLVNPDIDQETKDTLRLLSYGNIMFQSKFIERRVLEPKLFDRIFHFPVNIDNFQIDVEASLATESGRNAYTKNSLQNMIYEVDGKKYLNPKEINDMIFEDYFVSIQTNLRTEV